MRPRNNALFSIDWRDVFDTQSRFQHKEYFPIVNSRVFSLADDDLEQKGDEGSFQGYKQILNRDFRNTYQQLLYSCLLVQKSTDGGLDLPEKFKLQLTYYLELQDRINEARRVFSLIDLTKLQQAGDASCQMAYDYMAAYFDFYNSGDAEEDDKPMTQKFKVARSVVAKYQTVHVPNFKMAFQKLREQLQELDEADLIDEEVKAGDKPSFDADAGQDMTDD